MINDFFAVFMQTLWPGAEGRSHLPVLAISEGSPASLLSILGSTIFLSLLVLVLEPKMQG